MVAESEEDGAAGGISLSQVCAEYREQDIEAIKSEFADVVSSERVPLTVLFYRLSCWIILPSSRLRTEYLIV